MPYNNFDAKISVIAIESFIKGDLEFKYYTRIDGSVNGSIKSKAKLELSKTAVLKADIETKELVLYGNLAGDVKADSFTIKSGAEFKGSVNSKNFVIEDGAKVNLKALVK